MQTKKKYVTPVASTIAFLLAGCGGGQAADSSVAIVAGPVAAVAPTPEPSPTPAPPPATGSVGGGSEADAEAAAARRAALPLPKIDLSDMRLWNWDGKWHASEWNNGMGPIPWRFNRVSLSANGDAVLRMDAEGAPQLQAMNGTPTAASGFWEADVTLPRLKEGVVVAPLWLYDQATGDEIDFEYAGRNGLDLTMHTRAANGQMEHHSVRVFAGRDMSGERHRFGIRVHQGTGVAEMYLDGRLIHRWRRANMSSFVSRPLKPWIEMWAADPNNGGFVGWVGRWAGFAPSESMTMTVHGYAQGGDI